jgi:hypothetical protein
MIFENRAPDLYQVAIGQELFSLEISKNIEGILCEFCGTFKMLQKVLLIYSLGLNIFH